MRNAQSITPTGTDRRSSAAGPIRGNQTPWSWTSQRPLSTAPEIQFGSNFISQGLVWLAGQTGDWYGQSHRALSVTAEAGHQWSAAPWQPWLRAGILWASGDDDPADDRHGTFFQMLPTVRRYAQTALYSQMNNIDVFVQALARPTSALGLHADARRVGLATTGDHWYFGSGATQARGTQFGFATRPSHLRRDLANIVELSADYGVSRHWSMNGFLGVARGGEVVRRAFAGRTMTFAYVENVLQF